MDSDVRYIDAVDVAKLVRAALRREFPKKTFSVKTNRYSNGASIYVNWKCGPSSDTVEAVAGNFAGSRLHARHGYTNPVTHWLLPDGSTKVRYHRGSFGNEDLDPEIDNRGCGASLPPGTEAVSFGVDFIRFNRETRCSC